MSHYPRRSSYTPGSYLPFSSSSLYSSPSSSYLSVPSYKSRQRSSSYSNIYTPSPFLYQNASTSRSNSNTQLSESSSRRLSHSSSRSSLLDSKYSTSKSPLTYSSSSTQLNSTRCNDSPGKSSGERTNNLTSSRYTRQQDLQVTRPSCRASRDYGQLYEDAKQELQSLTEDYARKEKEWLQQKQSLEEKINEMEETAKSLPDLEKENKKLKDEHETLLRVLSKLNKDHTHCVH